MILFALSLSRSRTAFIPCAYIRTAIISIARAARHDLRKKSHVCARGNAARVQRRKKKRDRARAHTPRRRVITGTGRVVVWAGRVYSRGMWKWENWEVEGRWWWWWW